VGRSTSRWGRPLLTLLCTFAFLGTTTGGVLVFAQGQLAHDDDAFGPPPPPGPGAVTADDPDFAAGIKRSRDRAARLAAREAREARKASRRRFSDQSRAEALKTARKAFKRELSGRLPDGERPAAGVTVVRHVGNGAAIVEEAGSDRRLLLRSTVPLEVPDPSGGQQPLDLSLTARGGELAPEAAAVPLRIDDDGKAGVSLPDAGFAVTLRSAQSTDPLVESDRVFVANTQTDTDAAIVPQPFGAEILLQIRSAESPERFTVDVKLPEGASLRRARTSDPIPNDPPRAIEVVRGKESLGFIYPPLGYDADGQVFETAMRVEDDQIVLVAEHRGQDLRYPLLVDPEVIQWGRGAGNYGDWPGWGWTSVTYGSPSGFGSAKNNPAYYYGLYHSLPTHSTFNNGAYAEWYFRAPLNTYVYRAKLGNMAHSPFYCASPRTCSRWFNGITDYGNVNWEQPVRYQNEVGNFGPNPFGPAEHGAANVTHDYCFDTRCDRSKGQEQNFAILGLQAFNPYGGPNIYTDVNKATNTLGWADIYLGDRRAPTLDTRPGDAGWIDDNFATQSLTAYARDAGLGGYSLSLSGVSGGSTQYANCPYGTGNNRTYNCPTSWSASWSYTLNEGETRLYLSGQDVVGNGTGTHSWLRRIDRGNPTIQLSGPLYDRRGGLVRTGDLSLRVDATDGSSASASTARSGVRSLEVLVDGSRPTGAYKEQQCSQGSCTGFLDYTMKSGELSEGRHTVQAVVTDHAGHTARTDPFAITIDRTPPALDVSGALRDMEGQELTEGVWTMDAVAADEAAGRSTAGVALIEVTVDGSRLTVDGIDRGLIPQPDDCSEGGCPLYYDDIPYDTHEYAPGQRTIAVRAEDYAGNATYEDFVVGSSNNRPEREQQARASSPQFEVYHAGPSLDGIVVTEGVRQHLATDPEFPELGRQDNVTYLYGECPPVSGDAATVEGGCLPPIEIQSSPLCEKHKGLYQDAEAGVWEFEEKTIKGVPAASFDEGRILEIYTGNTTISVYGRDPQQVLRFADALRPALPEDVPELGQPLYSLSTASALTPALPLLTPPDPLVLQETEPCK
jgi:hypothetical protein